MIVLCIFKWMAAGLAVLYAAAGIYAWRLQSKAALPGGTEPAWERFQALATQFLLGGVVVLVWWGGRLRDRWEERSSRIPTFRGL